MVGTSGKYRLDTRLGGGGMAEVFIGSMLGAEGFSKRVAIKRVLPGYSDNPQFAQMFVAEAQISSRLIHPNIVSVLDFDRDPEGRLFLVMELVEGRDLDGLVSSGTLPFPVLIFVISEVLRGLGHAHDLPAGTDLRGIVHRDVSPHNVLLSWDGAVKVSDFGIAKARQASEATASVFIKGKPAYMSPEQANGQALDGRSDLFAVGVMLWEMLVGRRLFVGEDTRATLASVLFGQIPRPRSLRADIPKDLDRVTMKLLERDLPARYATAEAAIHELLECTDAPKSGREQLIKVLAERFPQHAPVRQSVMRSRGGTPPHVPQQHVPSHAQQTMVHGSGSDSNPPVAANPSIYNTPTGTMQPSAVVRRPGGSGKTLAIVGGALLVVGIVVVAAVMSASKKETKAADATGPVGSASSDVGSAPGSATAVTLATPDAALPDATPVAMAPPVDAGVPDAPQKDANSAQSAQAGVEKRTGRLIVHAFPIRTVYVDDRKIRDTPVDMKLSIGKHKVRLVGDDKEETVPVTIRENKTTTIER